MAALAAAGCDAQSTCTGSQCAFNAKPPGTLMWSQSLPIGTNAQFAMTSNDVLIASGFEKREEVVYSTLTALSPFGEILWSQDLGEPSAWALPSRPVVDENDDIYIAHRLKLYSFDANGQSRFTAEMRRTLEEDINYQFPAPDPTIGSDGTIYWQFLAATAPDGETRWRQYIDPDTPCESALAVRPDRVLFRGGNQIFALNDEGQVAWNVERPYDLLTDDRCVMIPYSERVVATLWCKATPSAFACGHAVFIDVETGDLLWQTEPPVEVPHASTALLQEDGSLLFFSIGPPGNEDYRSRMWTISPDGRTSSDPIELPWHSVVGAALGNDGIAYVSTLRGLAAVAPNTGHVLWTFEPEHAKGFVAGAPSIGKNGCIYWEHLQSGTPSWNLDRELVCVRSEATGLADTPWPRTNGANHSGLRSPF